MTKGKQTKFVFTIGGVLSGLGKGITTASIGLLLKQKGYSVTAIKIDPYISLDAGTMRPVEHGETFVTADGAEIDQDVGNYERFLDVDLTRANNITSGKIYQAVIDNERAFKYQGRDAEMFPDVINEVKRQIYGPAENYDVCLVEIGGTTGDLENLPFLHAAREIAREHDAVFIMVTYLPFLRNVGELKTKPTQHAVAALRSVGIFPDFIVTRNEVPLDQPRRETIAIRCFVDQENIIDNCDTDLIYKIPMKFEEERLADKIVKKLHLRVRRANMVSWNRFTSGLLKPKQEIRIGLIGKYFRHGQATHKDVYVSVNEAILHAAAFHRVRPVIVPVDSTVIEKEGASVMENYHLDSLIGPQGWGNRGTEGIIQGITYAREAGLPYFGLCFGMQLLTVEFARNVAGLKGANSTEIDSSTPHPVIHIMPDQKKYLEKNQYGGTIRLGNWPCILKHGTLVDRIYQHAANKHDKKCVLKIQERHRHRYEFNNDYRQTLVDHGLVIAGTSPDGKLVEAVELPQSVHPFFVGTQFHPEYQSRPTRPHPLFTRFIQACIERKKLTKKKTHRRTVSRQTPSRSLPNSRDLPVSSV